MVIVVAIQRMILFNELRTLITRWLNMLSHQRMANSLFGSDSPYATDILPPGFPLAPFVFPKRFQWTPAFSANPRRCQITLEYRGRTAVSSLLWSIQSSDVDFGVFEIPTQVFDDPLRPFPITAHLVLECLMKSVAAHRTIAILSEVLTHLVDGVPYMMKHFYLVALPERIIIRDVAARWVK
ncbi:hypothetical protein B0H15DRAFT_1024945, partial [Mycena belliarum]